MKGVFDTQNLYTQVEGVIAAIATDSSISVSDPTYPGQNIPLYQVAWGQRPDKCEKGKPLVYGWIVGDNRAANSTSDDILTLTFQIGVALSDRESSKSRQHWNLYFNRLQRAFAETSGMAFVYADPVSIELWNGTQTKAANWCLGDWGVSLTEHTSGRQVNVGGECGYITREMLVNWTMYICAIESKFRQLAD